MLCAARLDRQGEARLQQSIHLRSGMAIVYDCTRQLPCSDTSAHAARLITARQPWMRGTAQKLPSAVI